MIRYNAIVWIWLLLGPGDNTTAPPGKQDAAPRSDNRAALTVAPDSRMPYDSIDIDWNQVLGAIRGALDRVAVRLQDAPETTPPVRMAGLGNDGFEWTASGQLVMREPPDRDETEFSERGRVKPGYGTSAFDPLNEDWSSPRPTPPEDETPIDTRPLPVGAIPSGTADDVHSNEPWQNAEEALDPAEADESGEMDEWQEAETGGDIEPADDDDAGADEDESEGSDSPAPPDDETPVDEDETPVNEEAPVDQDETPVAEEEGEAESDTADEAEPADEEEDGGESDAAPAAATPPAGQAPSPAATGSLPPTTTPPPPATTDAPAPASEFTASDAAVMHDGGKTADKADVQADGEPAVPASTPASDSHAPADLGDFSDFSTIRRTPVIDIVTPQQPAAQPFAPEHAAAATPAPPAAAASDAKPAEPVAMRPPESGPPAAEAALAAFSLRTPGSIQATGNAPKFVRLAVDSHAILNTDENIDAVSVLHPQVADVVVSSPRKLYVIGKEVGDTQLRLESPHGMSVYRVSVEPNYQALETMIMATAPTSDVRIGTLKGRIVLIGRVSDAETVTKIEELAKVFQGGDVINHLAVSGVQQTVLRVAVAEVNKEAMRSLGINWAIGGSKLTRDFFFANNINQLNPTQFASNGLANVLTGQLTYSLLPNTNGAATNITFGFPRAELQTFVNALRENGLARTLAEPNLIAISGQTASFLAGGEVPIPVTQGGATAGAITIEYKEFGIRLAFTPTVGGGQVIRIHVMTEVSDPVTEARQINGLPVFSFRTRRVESTIECPNGHTFAIAGLLSESINAVSSKIPGVGDLPVLGTLFSSVEYQKQNTELVVLVTPQLVEALDPDQVTPLPGAEITEPSDLEFYFGQQLEGPRRNPEAGRASPEAAFEDDGAVASKRAPGRLQGPFGMSAFAEDGAAD